MCENKKVNENSELKVKVARAQFELKELEKMMNQYEKVSPGRDRVTSTQVRMKALENYIESIIN